MLKLPPNFLEGSQTRPSRNVDPKVDLQTNQAKKKAQWGYVSPRVGSVLHSEGKSTSHFGTLDCWMVAWIWISAPNFELISVDIALKRGKKKEKPRARFVQGYVSRANFLRGKRGVGLTSELKRRSLHFKRVYFEDFAGGGKWTPLVDPFVTDGRRSFHRAV